MHLILIIRTKNKSQFNSVSLCSDTLFDAFFHTFVQQLQDIQLKIVPYFVYFRDPQLKCFWFFFLKDVLYYSPQVFDRFEVGGVRRPLDDDDTVVFKELHGLLRFVTRCVVLLVDKVPVEYGIHLW